MIKLSIMVSLLLLLVGCNENKPTKNLDGKKLLESKCTSCHDTHMPPIVSDDELAPPMMAVAFHVYSFVKPSNESQRGSKAIEFVSDYALNPSFEKSFCDKESLKRYGLMPSQKGNVTEDEVQAIASYMFKHFTQENLTKRQEEKALYDALPAGKKLALQYKCLGCHKVDKKVVGPSFKDIASKYKDEQDKIIESIKSGSKANWESSKGAIMPPFKTINDNDLKILSDWIISTKDL
ncbi:MAG: c-type cytochrome [Campylobacterota bacterium]|nr:c-type cytochrome [Campylobacterota bacterium]